jgi:hypothetical protein
MTVACTGLAGTARGTAGTCGTVWRDTAKAGTKLGGRDGGKEEEGGQERQAGGATAIVRGLRLPSCLWRGREAGKVGEEEGLE